MAKSPYVIIHAEDDNGDSGPVKQTTNAGWVRIKAHDLTATNPFTVQGTDQYIAILGSATTYAALPSGSGKGPDTYSVDLSAFGSTDIYLVTLYTTGTIAGTVTVKYSQGSTSARLLHPETATTLIDAVAGNNEVLVPKKDGFAHFTVSQGAGTAETMWIYLIGRSVA